MKKSASARETSRAIRNRDTLRPLSGPDWDFERQLADGCQMVAGIDEVGRGCLAGPVYAAAVVLGTRTDNWLALNDSKKLSKLRREQINQQIEQEALGVGIGVASVEEIEELNILHAARLAMARAVNELRNQIDFELDVLLVDGTYEPMWQGPAYAKVKTVIDGDAKCPSIAAASIVAKVARDALMAELAKEYPGYALERNMGYGTPEHLDGLQRLGPTKYHRRGFSPVAKYFQMGLNLNG